MPTGDLKKGSATAGVQRQYTGTAGRIENAQVAVYLGYATRRGHALIDRELYLPKSWTGDPARCAAAGIPADVKFATKPELARRMIERAVTAKVPCAWVAGDEVYGDNGPLRTWLEQQHIAHVLAVACDHRVPAGAGRTVRADELAARLPRRAWQQLSAGDGAKGRRHYDWAWVTISHPGPGYRYLLIRRNRHTGELAFYRCYSPDPVPLATLVSVAGLRWTIEENFQASKGITGLDEHQVRRWASWYRWVTLAMLAAAVLTIAAALESLRTPDPAGQISLTPQRDRPPLRQPHHQAPARRQAPDPMVKLATTPPAPRQDLPLPAASSPRPMNVTIYGWSTSPVLADAVSAALSAGVHERVRVSARLSKSRAVPVKFRAGGV